MHGSGCIGLPLFDLKLQMRRPFQRSPLCIATRRDEPQAGEQEPDLRRSNCEQGGRSCRQSGSIPSLLQRAVRNRGLQPRLASQESSDCAPLCCIRFRAAPSSAAASAHASAGDSFYRVVPAGLHLSPCPTTPTRIRCALFSSDDDAGSTADLAASQVGPGWMDRSRMRIGRANPSAGSWPAQRRAATPGSRSERGIIRAAPRGGQKQLPKAMHPWPASTTPPSVCESLCLPTLRCGLYCSGCAC